MVLIGTNRFILLYPVLQILKDVTHFPGPSQHPETWELVLLFFREGNKDKESFDTCRNWSGGATKLSWIL